MMYRQNGKVAVFHLDAAGTADVHDIAGDIGMAQHNAFRCSCSAGGKQKNGHRIGVDRRVDIFPAAAFYQFFSFFDKLFPGIDAFFFLVDQGFAEIGAVAVEFHFNFIVDACQGVYFFRFIRCVENGVAFRTFDKILDRRGFQFFVDGDDDACTADDGEVGDHPFVTSGTDDGDIFAGKAHIHEFCTQRVDIIFQHSVGQRQIFPASVFLHEKSGAVCEQAAAFIDHLFEVANFAEIGIK